MQGLLLKIWHALKLPTDIQLFFMRRINDQFLVGVTGIFFDDKNRVLLVKHTYRRAARLDITYMGAFIGGVFTPSKEVNRAKLFEFDKLPILPGDQLLFVDKALKLKKNKEI